MRSNFRVTGVRSVVFTAALCSVWTIHAAQLTVTVQDNRGQPVPDAVVIATALNATPPSTEQHTAKMDQIDKRFEPETLVVRVGTSVSFPNSDSVAHQVYSFSPPKRFTLPLYRGKTHPPLVFDQPGVVVLGCNIHDQMIGYIVVTTSPYFGKTNDKGQWDNASLPIGTYRVSVWHPRLDEALADQELKLSDAESISATFRTKRALRPQAKSPDKNIRDY